MGFAGKASSSDNSRGTQQTPTCAEVPRNWDVLAAYSRQPRGGDVVKNRDTAWLGGRAGRGDRGERDGGMEG